MPKVQSRLASTAQKHRLQKLPIVNAVKSNLITGGLGHILQGKRVATIGQSCKNEKMVFSLLDKFLVTVKNSTESGINVAEG